MNAKKTGRFINILLLLLILFKPVILLSQENIPEDFCVNPDELKLYNMINSYRKGNSLPEIPLSRSLCYVAKLHVNDLLYNNPDTADCNLHSWSDKGSWVECCYGREKINQTCMTSKPMELTKYQGKGYEIAFWENVDAIPEVIIDLWKSVSASDDLILNKGTWKDKRWNAFGVGILKGFAVVWFGCKNDVEEGVKICNSNKIVGLLEKKVKNLTEQTGNGSDKNQASAKQTSRYYLVISSFKDKKTANSEMSRYKKRGFKNPKVVKSGDNYRVSLGDFTTREEAITAKKRLGNKYKDVWILKL